MVVMMSSLPKIETTDAPAVEREVVETVDWNAENEVKFFYALRNRRPVGTERFFEMVLISETFNNLMGKDIPSSVIWNHLDEMYDMDTLNENNSPPPELTADTDFELPSSDFGELLSMKMEETAHELSSNSAGPSSEQIVTPSSKAASSKMTDSLSKPKVAKTLSVEGESVKKDNDSGKGDTESAKPIKKYSRASQNKSSSDSPSTTGKTSTLASSKGKRLRN